MDETSLARDGGASERRPGIRAIGASLPRITGPIVAKHGGGLVTRLKAEWAAIVGPELAAATWPEALARGGTLRLRVAPAHGLTVQHRAPLVIERVNLFFGREAVVRLALMQGPLPLPAPRRAEPGRVLAAGEAAALDSQIETVADPELRESLGRLGRRVIASET